MYVIDRLAENSSRLFSPFPEKEFLGGHEKIMSNYFVQMFKIEP